LSTINYFAPNINSIELLIQNLAKDITYEEALLLAVKAVPFYNLREARLCSLKAFIKRLKVPISYNTLA
jgi:hypothetical protein